MKTHQTIGLLFASAAVLLPSCETERVNERPIGLHPVGPYANDPNGFGNNLQNEVQANPLDPNMGQNSGFNPDPGGMGGGTIGRLVGGENNLPPTRPADPRPMVPSPGPVVDPIGPSVPSGPAIAQPKPVTPVGEAIPVAWPTEDPTVVISPYDRTKKIKILNRSTNKPYAAGTILRDTNFPKEVKKFRVP